MNETKQPAVGPRLDAPVRPCGWRWLDSWVFRKRVPRYSTAAEWGPVYDQQTLDAAVDAERVQWKQKVGRALAMLEAGEDRAAQVALASML